MKYQIRFTAGELAGKIFPIQDGEALTLGRSRSNTVHITAPDVSGHHVILNKTATGIKMDNVSSRTTTVDGQPVPAAQQDYPLVAGQTVTLGSVTAFTLEAIDDQPPKINLASKKPETDEDDQDTHLDLPPKTPQATENEDEVHTVIDPAPKPQASQDEDRTAIDLNKPAPAPKPAPPPAPAPTPEPEEEEEEEDENATIAMQTRMATAEEMEFMKGKHQKERSKQFWLTCVAIFIVINILIFVYRFYFYRAPEKYASWPMSESGELLATNLQFEGCPWLRDIDIEYPDVEGATIEKNFGNIKVNTFIGKYRDVPLFLTMEYFQDFESLSKSRQTVFEEWMAKKASGNENWNFDVMRPVNFYQYDHGIPYVSVSYSRTKDSESFYGVAVMIRMEEWIFILLKEIPMRERWHAEYFVNLVSFFRFSEVFQNVHWEGLAEQAPGTIQENLTEARQLLMRRSPSVWQKAELLLKSALCKYRMEHAEGNEYETAIKLLKDLRENQIHYFNAQKILMIKANTTKDLVSMRNLQDNLKAVFSSEEDFRFHKIRRNQWD